MAASKSWQSADLSRHLEKFFTAQGVLDARLCVAFSGGRDSAVLLHAAAKLGLAQLGALHVNHGLSPNADAWQAHCAKFCAGLGVALQVERVEIGHQGGLGLEAAARNARYDAFARANAEAILLAHHQGDQAETVLFNLVRGAGTAGAAGIPAVRSSNGLHLLRPLLDVPPEAVAAYAEANALIWVEDESNRDHRFSRNFIRHQVMPVLADRFPSATQCLAASAGRFAEAEELLADLAAMDWEACAEGDVLRLKAARHLSSPRLKNLLRWRLRCLHWRAPVAARMDEFVHQILTAGPDRHPLLELAEGKMHVKLGRLFWERSGNICER
ncbi:MAG: tRNA lysidine(34) synthetase TilS [Betaproteobacteria bacterium]